MILLRTLAAGIQEGASHPLKSSILGPLTDGYGSNASTTLSFRGKIVKPVRMLQALGIDIFADHRYDTWVLQTAWARIVTNYAEAKLRRYEGAILLPLNSMFNHSCEENMEDVNVGSSVTKTVSKKDIKAGEELFKTYVDPNELKGMSRDERSEALRWWVGESGCECEKYQQEV